MDIDSSPVSLESGGYLDVGVVASDVADFGFPRMYRSLELVDPSPGLCEALVSDGASAVDRRNEAVSDGSCRVGEGVVLHVEEGRS